MVFDNKQIIKKAKKIIKDKAKEMKKPVAKLTDSQKGQCKIFCGIIHFNHTIILLFFSSVFSS